jgi:fibronectin type 3 domain-containing protein
MKKLATILLLAFMGVGAFAADFKLVWDNNLAEDQVTGYNVYQKNNTTLVYSLIGTSTTNSFNLVGVNPPAKYTYAVAAVNVWGESLLSLDASTPPAAGRPANLRVTKP